MEKINLINLNKEFTTTTEAQMKEAEGKVRYKYLGYAFFLKKQLRQVGAGPGKWPSGGG